MINMIIIDDNPHDLFHLFGICNTFKKMHLTAFQRINDAEMFIAQTFVDIAFISVQNKDKSSISLGYTLRAVNPDAYLVYAVFNSKISINLLRLRIDGILYKPYSIEELSHYIERALCLNEPYYKNFFIKTFGSFEIYNSQESIHIPISKARELLALCVDRKGAIVTQDEAITILWPNRDVNDQTKRLYRKATACLKSVFGRIDGQKIFESGRGFCKINPNFFRCDRYLFDLDATLYSKSVVKKYLYEYAWAKRIDLVKGELL